MSKYNLAALADWECQIKKLQDDKANCMASLAKDLPPGVSLVYTNDVRTKCPLNMNFTSDFYQTKWSWRKCPKCEIVCFSSEGVPKCEFCGGELQGY